MGGGGGINVRAVALLLSAQLGLHIDLWKTTHVFFSDFQYCQPLLSHLVPRVKYTAHACAY